MKDLAKKYVAYGHISEDSEEINKWFRYCQAKRIPYITLLTRRRFATIQWDYINLPSDFDDILSKKGDDFIQGFREIFQRFANKKSEYRVGNFVATFIDIEIEKAPHLAEELFDYIYEQLNLDAPSSNSAKVISDKRTETSAVDAQLARYERIISAATAMSDSEKVEFAKWEKCNVTGDGRFASSDWPGWSVIIKRISH